MSKSLNQYQQLIVQWAKERNLIEGSTPKDQFHKLIQECAELSDNVCKQRDAKDDIGDVFVVLTIMAEQLGYGFTECVEKAYNDIKDRKGKMIDGVFVKEADLIPF